MGVIQYNCNVENCGEQYNQAKKEEVLDEDAIPYDVYLDHPDQKSYLGQVVDASHRV